MSITAAVLWSVVLLVVEHLSIAVTTEARPAALTDIVNITACEVLATSLVTFFVLRIYVPTVSIRRALGLVPLSPYRAVLAVAMGVGMCPAMSWLDDRVLARFPYDDPQALDAMRALVAGSPRVALVLGAFVVIPAVRELFFRGLLFSQVRPNSTVWVTLGVTTALFALASLDGRAMPSALIFGLALGCLRVATGSAVAPVLAQLGFWSVDAIPILRGRDPSADVTFSTHWIVVGAIAATMALLSCAEFERRSRIESRRRSA